MTTDLKQTNTALDEILKFPCQISIKAIGKNTLEFNTHVVQLIRQHCDDILESAVSCQQSKNGNYLSVTVKITAKNRRQADNIYQTLTDDKLVIMAI